MSTVDPARARSFDAWAGEYDLLRPGYPEELFATISRQLTLPQPPLVVDLGAGTGRASLAMAELNWRVTAVEPGKQMLEMLLNRASDRGLLVSTVHADAEATGLDPDSADLVTAAQAFHWFDPEQVVPEMARILKPGGGVALFWNVRDRERSAFLADYAKLLDRHAGEKNDMGRYEATGHKTVREAFAAHSAAFNGPELTTLHQELAMTPEQFMGMAFTASYIRVGLTPDQQDRFRLELAALLGRHGHAGGQPFPVPYRIDLWIARRRGA